MELKIQPIIQSLSDGNCGDGGLAVSFDQVEGRDLIRKLQPSKRCMYDLILKVRSAN